MKVQVFILNFAFWEDLIKIINNKSKMLFLCTIDNLLIYRRNHPVEDLGIAIGDQEVMTSVTVNSRRMKLINSLKYL